MFRGFDFAEHILGRCVLAEIRRRHLRPAVQRSMRDEHVCAIAARELVVACAVTAVSHMLNVETINQ